jgi:hypothetical protein
MRFEYLTTFVPVAYEKEERGAWLFNISAKGFSTHSESSSLGGEEFGIVESSRR